MEIDGDRTWESARNPVSAQEDETQASGQRPAGMLRMRDEQLHEGGHGVPDRDLVRAHDLEPDLGVGRADEVVRGHDQRGARAEQPEDVIDG